MFNDDLAKFVDLDRNPQPKASDAVIPISEPATPEVGPATPLTAEAA